MYLLEVTLTVGAVATRGSYSERSLPLYMYNVGCSGEEASVFDCSHSRANNGVPSCSQNEDAGVICQGHTYKYHSCYHAWF